MKYFLITLVIFISITQAQYRWEKLNGPPGGNVTGLAVKGDTLIAGTGAQKAMIFYSSNKGLSWKQADIKLQHRFADFVFTDDGGIIAASWSNNKLFKSFDMYNWTSVLSNNVDDFWSLGKDKDGFIYAGTDNGEIYVSTDNGLNWLLNYNGSARIKQFHLTDSSTFFAGTFYQILKKIDNEWISIPLTDISLISILSDQNGNLYVHDDGHFMKSTDGGFNWQLQSVRTLTSMYYSLYNQRIIGTHSDLSFAGGTTWGIMVSEDEGVNWMMSNQGLPPRFSSAFKIVKSGTDTYISTNAAGVFRSTDFGESWFPVNNGLNAAITRDFRIARDGTYWTANWSNGIASSTDVGKSWMVKNSGLSNSYSISIIEDDNGILISGTENGIYRSTDQGESWIQTAPSGNNVGFNLYKDVWNRIYVTTLTGIYRTLDTGLSWERIDQGAMNNYYIYGFTIDSLDNLYAGTSGGKIYRSTNDGLSWTRVYQSGISESRVWDIAAAPNGDIYAANRHEGILKSTDHGVTWELKNNGLTYLYTGYLEINKKGEVFFNTLSQYLTPDEDKIYRSVDNGETWENITSNLFMTSVRNIRFDEEDNIYLATDESVWRSYPDSTTQTADIDEIIYEYSLAQNYPNPFNPTTTFKFSLPENGFVTLKIYDIIGNEIAVLVNEEKPEGGHQAEWNASSFSSGVYFYRITVIPIRRQAGGFTSTKKLLLMK